MAKKQEESYHDFMHGVLDVLNTSSLEHKGFYGLGREATDISIAFKKWLRED